MLLNFSALMNGFTQANAKEFLSILLYLLTNDTWKDDIPFTRNNTVVIPELWASECICMFFRSVEASLLPKLLERF